MIVYEWDLETVDEHGDVIDHEHFDRLADAPPFEGRKLVLVMDDDDGRAWSYVEEGKLSEWFLDASERHIRKVPQRFHAELERFNRKNSLL